MAAEWHPSRNGDWRPSDVRTFCNDSAWWRCSCGNEWEALISNRSRGCGCPECGRKKSARGRKVPKRGESLSCKRPAVAALWHPTLNGSTLPEHVRPSTRDIFWWRDEHGHEWESSVYDQVACRSLCPLDSNRLIAGLTDLATTHPELASQWHPTRNGNLTPADVKAGSDDVVWWHCESCKHEWPTAVCNRALAETGCGACKTGGTSKVERAIFDALRARFPDAIHGHALPRFGIDKRDWKVDYFIPSLSLAIEFDGQRWHGPRNAGGDMGFVLAQARDRGKSEELMLHGYRVVRIREGDTPVMAPRDIHVPTLRGPRSATDVVDRLVKHLSVLGYDNDSRSDLP